MKLFRFEDAVYKKHILNFYLNSGRMTVCYNKLDTIGFDVVLSGHAKWKINVKEILKLIRE